MSTSSASVCDDSCVLIMNDGQAATIARYHLNHTTRHNITSISLHHTTHNTQHRLRDAVLFSQSNWRKKKNYVAATNLEKLKEDQDIFARSKGVRTYVLTLILFFFLFLKWFYNYCLSYRSLNVLEAS